MSWSPIGPRPITGESNSGKGNASGRVISIAPHPTDANICYISSASGGVWKTTNGGTNWTPLTDELPTTNGGAITLDPADPDTIYYGTGEWQQQSQGDGVYRSTDAGATWVQIATVAQTGDQISGIAVAPGNSSLIYVTSRSGFHRSLDGGATWNTKLNGNATALVTHPTNGAIVYIGFAFPTNPSGIYKSNDSGDSFTAATLANSRVVMDISKSNPNVLYAAFIGGNDLIGLVKTINAGANWTQIAAPNFCWPQCSYDAYVAVDPNDSSSNTVYCGGVDPYAITGVIKTTNGGASWTEISTGGDKLHPDHHAMAFGPGGIIWEGNDGGVSKSTNAGTSWINCNADFQISQIYNIVQHPTSPQRFLGGTQDNGTPERIAANNSWPQLRAGDGGFSVFDFADSTVRYTTYPRLLIFRFNGGIETEITGAWKKADPVNFTAPMVGDPNAATTLVGGTNRVWRTVDADAAKPTWNAISTNAVGAGGTLNSIAIAKTDSNTIYTGSSTGKVFVTNDLSNWNNRSAGLPTGNIGDIVISPTDPATAFVTFWDVMTGGRIFKTTNSGVNWTNITGTLPNGVGAQALAIDWAWPAVPGMYVGTGAGVYVSLDGGQNWIKDGPDLPNVNINDLFIDPALRTIVAGTYGRGAWRSNLPVPYVNTACITPPANMALWLPFDQVWGNPPRTINAVTGEPRGMLLPAGGGPTFVPGQFVNNSLFFDGQDDYVSVPNHAPNNIADGDLSIDAWVMPNGNLPALSVIVDKRVQDASFSFWGYHLFLMGDNAGSARIGFQLADGIPNANGDTHTNWVTGWIPNLSGWQHIAVTVDRDNAAGGKFYLNGQQIGGSFNPMSRQGSLANESPVTVGARSTVPSSFFAGGIDEVEVFRRVLDDSEVKGIFDAKANGKCKHIVQVPRTAVFCGNDTSATVEAHLINFTPFITTFDGGFYQDPCPSFAPTNFPVLIPPLPVATWSVAVVSASATKPPGMAPGDQACFSADFTAAGLLALSAKGSVVFRPDISCWDGGTSTMSLPPGSTGSASLGFGNTAITSGAFAYRVEAIGPDGRPSTTLSINGAAPGIALEGQANIPVGSQFELALEVEFVDIDALGLTTLQLLTDTEGNGNFITAASAALMYEAPLSDFCPSDFDGSGFVDTDDFTGFILAFEAGADNADFDGTGFIDLEDYIAFVAAFEAGC
ncbi:MAG: hypothetical protein IT435_17675 [Phycisphaerales bacterium]|nr:hypothetical protein [Phycisphaerales bacterium]